MSIKFELRAEARQDAGKGASRRLRRAGKVPAILYGGSEAPQMLSLDHDPVMHSLAHEAFYSHVLTVHVGGKKVSAVLKDLHRHPYKPVLMHLDLQRVSATEKLRMNIPVHFIGADIAPGVKQAGGLVEHLLTEVAVSCLPQDLPEYLELDISAMNVGETLHLSNVRIPAGVELIDLQHGPEHDLPVVSIHLPRAAVEAAGEAASGEAGEEGAAS